METVDLLKAHLQQRSVAISCQSPCLRATFLSTREFTQSRPCESPRCLPRILCRWQTSYWRLSPLRKGPKERLDVTGNSVPVRTYVRTYVHKHTHTHTHTHTHARARARAKELFPKLIPSLGTLPQKVSPRTEPKKVKQHRFQGAPNY